MKAKNIISIIMGLSLNFGVAASADPGTQGPDKNGVSVGQISPISIKTSELNQRIDQCLESILIEHVLKFTKPYGVSPKVTAAKQRSFASNRLAVEFGSCLWELNDRDFQVQDIEGTFRDYDKNYYIGIRGWKDEKACRNKSKKGSSNRANADSSYFLKANIAPRIVCSDSHETIQIVDADTGDYQVTNYSSNCSVINNEGEKIEFYNPELKRTLQDAGRSKEIKPQFIYPRQLYVQCLQEAISH